VLTETGRDGIRDRCKDATTDVPSHIQAGTGTTPATETDTDLETPVGSRIALSSITTETGKVIYDGTIGAGDYNGYDLTELALFNIVTGGACWTRDVWSPPISKNSQFSINAKVTFQINPNAS